MNFMTNNPWESIHSPANDLKARLVDPLHPLDFYWARDHLNHYLFLYELPVEYQPDNNMLPNLAGIKAIFTSLNRTSSKHRLVLILNEQANWEMFNAVCNDLIQSTRQTENTAIAVHTVLRRLQRWHEFLKKNKSDLLPEERIKGLIGELHFLANHLFPVFGPRRAITFWQGPTNAPQDFNVRDCAIEVKCQSGTTSPYIKISSVDQLCPQVPEMYLFVVTLGKAEDEANSTVTLPRLVSHVRELLLHESFSDLEHFNDLLYETGYIDADKYDDFKYVLISESMFEVNSEFPSICREMIPDGVTNLTYHIALSKCQPFIAKPIWMGDLS
jgi:hypothetical protein